MSISNKVSLLCTVFLSLLLLTQCQEKGPEVTPQTPASPDIKQIEASFKGLQAAKPRQRGLQLDNGFNPVLFSNLWGKNEIQVGEEVVIGWSFITGGGQLPSSFSIYLMQGGRYRGTIASSLTLSSKTIPDPYDQEGNGNFLWIAPNTITNNATIEFNKEYTLFLQANTGEAMDSHAFTLKPRPLIINLPSCSFNVSPYIDGDYALSFDINNQNNCYQNITYRIDWGDGTTHETTRSTNTFTLNHQFPFGFRRNYNVNISKYQGEELKSSKTVTVFAKRD